MTAEILEFKIPPKLSPGQRPGSVRTDWAILREMAVKEHAETLAVLSKDAPIAPCEGCETQCEGCRKERA